MNATTAEKTDPIAEAWQRWWAADYSWEGLAKQEWRDGKTLRDYWLTHPKTGGRRAESTMRKSGELIAVKGQPTFHICHLPLVYADGTPTLKSTDPDGVKARMDKIVRARLTAAIPPSDDIDEIAAITARLDGTVFLDPDLSKQNFDSALNATFGDCVVSGDANFRSAAFSRYADFVSAAFSGYADFLSADFSGYASFNSAAFSGGVDFVSAAFSGDADFQSATFSGYADFESAAFSGSADFENAAFTKGLTFSQGRFEKGSRFQDVKWPHAPVDHHGAFRDAVFKELANFGGAGFRAFAAFEGARFHNGLRLDKSSQADAGTKTADFERRARATFNRELDACKAIADTTEREQRLEELEGGCRTLKNEMIKQADKSREQLLYKFELLARREQASTSRFERWFSYAYDGLSDYGGSAARPLGWLIGLIVAFSLIHATFLISWPPPFIPAASSVYPTKTESAQCAAAVQFPVKGNDIAPLAVSLSLSRVFPFGGFEDVSKRLATAYDCHDLSGRALGFRIWATLESLLALILAFLFGLAVRRRFQIS